MLVLSSLSHGGSDMLRQICLAFLTIASVAGGAKAQPTAELSDSAKELIGGWELSNADRDKRCQLTIIADPAPGGFKLDLDPSCQTVFPQLKGVMAWVLGRNDVLRFVDARGTAAFEFTEVEN